MATRWKSLCMNVMLKIICLCEAGGLSKSKVKRLIGLIILTLHLIALTSSYINPLRHILSYILQYNQIPAFYWFISLQLIPMKKDQQEN
jgi:hypothetical protein